MNANAPPFPASPAIGQWHGDMVFNGARWVRGGASGGVRVIQTVFNASGTYVPSPGLVSVKVECIGGGGGGGDVAPVTGISGGGGGGGAGGYSRSTLAAALVLGGVNVTVGAGGAPQATGGTTSFGGLVVANGGQGAMGFAAGGIDPVTGNATWGQPGWGGPPGVGQFVCGGNAGTPGQNFYFGQGGADLIVVIYGGMGGAGPFGGSTPQPGAGPGNVVVGEPTPSWGAGSGGPGNVANQSDLGAVQPGAHGTDGVCIVTEYCTVDSGGGGGGDICGPNPADPCWPGGSPNVCWPPGGWDDC